jgi:LysM repeat protein
MVVLAAAALFLTTRAGAGANEPLETYTVSRGDTLWSIAVEESPSGEDPRARVAEIQRVNHLEDPQIQPGMTLYLPAA